MVRINRYAIRANCLDGDQDLPLPALRFSNLSDVTTDAAKPHHIHARQRSSQVQAHDEAEANKPNGVPYRVIFIHLGGV
jgi:hypothetical protein